MALPGRTQAPLDFVNKKGFDTAPLWYTPRALEMFLSMRAARPRNFGAVGGSSPSLKKDVSAIAYLRAVGFLLALVLSAGLASARAEIIAYVDENGRRIYVNVEDEELRVAVERGGVSAAQRLLERRRGSMPGIEQHIRQAAREHAVDPLLIHAIIQVESAWNPRARSRKGALGLMQLMPATGARFGVRDFFDPKQNVTGGVRYLRFLLDRFDNDPELALAGYNAGENAVAAAGGVPPYRETREYLKRVNALYEFSRSHVPGTGSIYQVADEHGRTIYIND